MATDVDNLKERLRRWTLLLGVLQITVGCTVGFLSPSDVAWYRGIVMSHIEFTANGVLMVAFGFLINELRLNSAALIAWFTTLLIGTWTNGTAGLAAAFIGSSSQFMPTLNEKFPPPHGVDSAIVTNLLMLCGVTMMATLLLTIYGLARPKAAPRAA